MILVWYYYHISSLFYVCTLNLLPCTFFFFYFISLAEFIACCFYCSRLSNFCCCCNTVWKAFFSIIAHIVSQSIFSMLLTSHQHDYIIKSYVLLSQWNHSFIFKLLSFAFVLSHHFNLTNGVKGNLEAFLWIPFIYYLYSCIWVRIFFNDVIVFFRIQAKHLFWTAGTIVL